MAGLTVLRGMVVPLTLRSNLSVPIERTIKDAIAQNSAHTLQPGERLETRYSAVAAGGINQVNHISLRGDLS